MDAPTQPSTTDPTSQQMLQELKVAHVRAIRDAIFNDRARVAFDISRSIRALTMPKLAHLLTAEFWLHTARAALLIGHDPRGALDHMRISEGYNDSVEAAFQRDCAVLMVQLHRFNEADQLLVDIEKLENLTPVDISLCDIIAAIVLYGRGDYEEAVNLHHHLELKLALDGAPIDARALNAFHHFKTVVAMGDKAQSYSIGGEFRRENLIQGLSPHQQKVIASIDHDLIGRPNLKLMDWMEHIKARRRTHGSLPLYPRSANMDRSN